MKICKYRFLMRKIRLYRTQRQKIEMIRRIYGESRGWNENRMGARKKRKILEVTADYSIYYITYFSIYTNHFESITESWEWLNFVHEVDVGPQVWNCLKLASLLERFLFLIFWINLARDIGISFVTSLENHCSVGVIISSVIVATHVKFECKNCNDCWGSIVHQFISHNYSIILQPCCKIMHKIDANFCYTLTH